MHMGDAANRTCYLRGLHSVKMHFSQVSGIDRLPESMRKSSGLNAVLETPLSLSEGLMPTSQQPTEGVDAAEVALLALWILFEAFQAPEEATRQLHCGLAVASACEIPLWSSLCPL